MLHYTYSTTLVAASTLLYSMKATKKKTPPLSLLAFYGFRGAIILPRWREYFKTSTVLVADALNVTPSGAVKEVILRVTERAQKEVIARVGLGFGRCCP
jgi:hypothetical protein